MKAFQQIVVLFYKAEVLREEPILKWYRDTRVAKGKSVFLEQMKSLCSGSKMLKTCSLKMEMVSFETASVGQTEVVDTMSCVLVLT